MKPLLTEINKQLSEIRKSKIHGVDDFLDIYKKECALRGCFYPTTDDWYPSFPDGLVLISLLELNSKEWRVSVWGADDTGMEIDVASRDTAYQILKSLPTIISKQDLYERGFICA